MTTGLKSGKISPIPGSSNGRTTDSESVYRGSSPCPGASLQLNQLEVFLQGLEPIKNVYWTCLCEIIIIINVKAKYFKQKIKMNAIIGLVGSSGSGKSTLIQEIVKIFPSIVIAKSLTTRPRRSNEDVLFYDFVSLQALRLLEKEGRLTHVSEYAGYYYSNDKKYLDSLLENHYGITALVESGVECLRRAGYEVKTVKIQPADYTLTADVARQKADRQRALSCIKPDLEVLNSFHTGGLEKSVKTLSDFINSWLV